MRCSGMAYGKIAAALNEKSILSPRWHWELHYGKKGSCKYSKLWTYATVKNILNDTVYLGIVTQNRTGSRSYKDKTMIQKPETEWICHEDAHEAIVDRKLWETVQEKNRAVKQQAANRAAPLPALFTGKLVCADCGHPLVATRETQRRKNGTSKRYVSYICSHFVTTGRSACSWHRIYEISLKTLVLNEIRAHSRAVAQDENAVLDKLRQQILSESAARQEDSRLEISRLRRRIGELEHMTAKLYEDKVSGIINNDTFAVLIQKTGLFFPLYHTNKAVKDFNVLLTLAVYDRAFSDLDVVNQFLNDFPVKLLHIQIAADDACPLPDIFNLLSVFLPHRFVEKE